MKREKGERKGGEKEEKKGFRYRLSIILLNDSDASFGYHALLVGYPNFFHM